MNPLNKILITKMPRVISARSLRFNMQNRPLDRNTVLPEHCSQRGVNITQMVLKVVRILFVWGSYFFGTQLLAYSQLNKVLPRIFQGSTFDAYVLCKLYPEIGERETALQNPKYVWVKILDLTTPIFASFKTMAMNKWDGRWENHNHK